MGLDIPVWGQFSIMGVLLGIVAYIVVAVIRGELVPAKRLEQETHRADKWQEAWEASQSVATSQAETLKEMSALAEVFEAFIRALPKIEGDKHAS